MTSRRDFLKLLVAAPAVILTPGLLMRVRPVSSGAFLRSPDRGFFLGLDRGREDFSIGWSASVSQDGSISWDGSSLTIESKASQETLAEIERAMTKLWDSATIKPEIIAVAQSEAAMMDRALFEYYSEKKNKFAPPAIGSAARQAEGSRGYGRA